MKSLENISWTEANQKYLSAALRVIQGELEQYHHFTKKGKTFSRKSEENLENARNERDNLEKSLPNPPALRTLVNLFGLSEFEEKILLMCAGVELDTEFGKSLIEPQSDEHLSKLPTFSLALTALSNAHWSAITEEGPLRSWRLIELNKNFLISNSSLCIDEPILHYLTGIQYLDPRLQYIIKEYIPEHSLVLSHQHIADKITDLFSRISSQTKYPIIQLTGENYEDKLAVAAEAMACFGIRLYTLPAQLLPSVIQEHPIFLRLWNRSALLNRAALFIDARSITVQDQNTRQTLLNFIDNTYGVVFLGTDQRKLEISRQCLLFDICKPTVIEQQNLWKEGLENLVEIAENSFSILVSQFNLDAHSIHNLTANVLNSVPLEDLNVNRKRQVFENVWKACLVHTRPDLEDLAQYILPKAGWEDLVLPAAQKKTLREIVAQVKHRHRVYYEWGFAGKSTRGLGVSALFFGESGTGKTMAAEVLARELNLDLYRVDLSQIVNKYIGETEKNLKKIFDAAEESGAILLFDEADALFGKRTDAKDSVGRYANMETGYLLQRMEAYNGLAILTTNMKNSLDTAFMRRIRFAVAFPFPGNEMRAEIWEKAFPSKTPTKDLDYTRLSKMNITGGHIRNIALNASFVAAEKNLPVSMEEIFEAARQEYAKLDKQMSSFENIL